jgi:hypothetical protein
VRSISLSSLTDPELIDGYSEVARIWGHHCQAGDVRRANRVAPRLGNLGDELQARGSATRLKLTPLLDDPDPGIRYCVAGQLEDRLPERCRTVFERIWLSALVGLSFSARMRLD